MASTWFEENVKAQSAEIGFQYLRERAIRNCGEDPYNGTISTIGTFRTVKRFDKYSDTKQRKNEVKAIIERYIDTGQKWEAYCIDLGVVEYVRISYTKKTKKTTAKYKLGFMLKKMNYTYHHFEEIAFKGTKKELETEIQKALKKDPDAQLIITKEYKLISGDNVETEIVLKQEKFQKCPKYKKDTFMIEEVHKYIFMGYASC